MNGPHRRFARGPARGAAVALFAREPVPGRTKSRLARAIGDGAAATLAEAFLRDAAGAVATAEAWTPWLYVDPPARAAAVAELLGWPRTQARPQAAGHIGLRMLAAATELHATGYAPVVIVAADVPLLGPGHLHRALRALRRADVAWGPAENGGYYLVGGWEPRPALFDDPALRWGEADVLDTSERLARQQGLTTARLAPELDIDTAADLQVLAARLQEVERRGGPPPRHTLAALRTMGQTD